MNRFNKKFLSGIICISVFGSVVFTGCSFFDSDNNKPTDKTDSTTTVTTVNKSSDSESNTEHVSEKTKKTVISYVYVTGTISGKNHSAKPKDTTSKKTSVEKTSKRTGKKTNTKKTVNKSNTTGKNSSSSTTEVEWSPLY